MKLLGLSLIRHQQAPVEVDFPSNMSNKLINKNKRTFACVAHGNLSWNQVARKIAIKLKWDRFLKLSVINNNFAFFQPNNDQEWQSCWKPLKWNHN
ncbi:hypothetical protein MKX03_024321, partial [Papaver bracteatum]